MMGIDTVIGLASLAIAIPGLVETFIHAGRYLSNKLQSAQVSPDVVQIQEFILLLNRGIIRLTLESVEDLYCDTEDAALRATLKASAEQLWAKMIELDREISKLKAARNTEKQTEKAMEAALDSIKSMKELESRLRAYVQVQVGWRQLPSRLEFRPNQFCFVGDPVRLPHSPVTVARGDFNRHSRRGTQPCLVEEKVFPGLRSSQAYERAVDLARILQFVKSSGGGLLELVGFEVLAGDRFHLVFSFPDGRVNPRSLRDVLLDPVNQPRPPIPRNYRFILPRKLAEAVYQVHQQNLVHKCIRPESILLFEPAPGDIPELKYPKTIGAPYLVDWQHVRRTVEASKREVYHDDWTMAMYQHPERQAQPGSVAESKYNIGHDIYSLGVCFLEIGLWDSFVVVNNGGGLGLSPVLSEAKDRWKNENPAWTSMTDSQIEQKVFISLAGDRLAYEMGEVYSKLVLKCLSCIGNGFGNTLRFVDSSSRDWDEQGVLFIQEIRKELATASTMGIGIYNRIQ
ncbi:hypothetical protein DL767_006672 [Monosporascus sp. MG133]|nr:hypothetical protein DL767_006672 [Monosporascus sp. MG133]